MPLSRPTHDVLVRLNMPTDGSSLTMPELLLHAEAPTTTWNPWTSPRLR